MKHHPFNKQVTILYKTALISLFIPYYFIKLGVWAHKTSYTRYFLLKCIYQTRRVIGHVFVCVSDIAFASYYDFSVGCRNCSDNAVFFANLIFNHIKMF